MKVNEIDKVRHYHNDCNKIDYDKLYDMLKLAIHKEYNFSESQIEDVLKYINLGEEMKRYIEVTAFYEVKKLCEFIKNWKKY